MALFCCTFSSPCSSSAQVQLTPLDSALMAEQEELAAVVLEQGGITIARIHNMAATRIQACFRGHRIRKMFKERKKLIVRHEQLRARKKEKKKDRKRSRGEEKKKVVEEGEETSKGGRRRHRRIHQVGEEERVGGGGD